MKNKDRGILYIALGKEFDKLTAASACYSRQFTGLPMTVLSNLKVRNVNWKNVSNIHFKYIELSSNRNREIKVSLIDYTPYKETLYMDSDAVIQNRGVESLFDYLKNFEVACQFFGTFHQRDMNLNRVSAKKIYDKLTKLLNEPYPIKAFGEAALLFRKTDICKEFFILWKKYWKLTGSGRDMPGFSFAVKHMRDRVMVFRKIKFCTNPENQNFFIQHKGFKNFEKKFGLPNYTDWNPKF